MAQDIADTVDVCPEIPILEVGPGMGVLTQFLLPKERNVKVVELDYESVAYLREAYPQLEDNIIEDDFLKMNLQRLFGAGQQDIRNPKCTDTSMVQSGVLVYGTRTCLQPAPQS